MEADFNYHGDVVVFDLDDTLMLERDYCRSGFRLIAGMLAARHGAQWLGISKRLDTILRRRGAYFDFLETQLAREAGLSDAALRSEMQQLVDAYRSHVPKRLNLRPGVREMLDELRRRRVVMAMITDGRSVTQRAKLKALGIEKYFHPANILISQETSADKSTPANFECIVRRYPEARRFHYVADNVAKDFLMPSLMGWQTWRVPPHHDEVHTAIQPADTFQQPQNEMHAFSDIFVAVKGG